MSQLFLGYLTASVAGFRMVIYRDIISSNPAQNVTFSDSKTTPAKTPEQVVTWIKTLLETPAKNTYNHFGTIDGEFDTSFGDILTTVKNAAVANKKTAFKLSFVMHSFNEEQEAVPSIRAVITSNGVKSVNYYNLVALPE